MDTDKHGLKPKLAITAVAILLSVFSSGCGNGCSNSVLNEVVSPDGKYVATAFIRDCGSTTDFSPQVSLRQFGQKLVDTGNIFVGNHSDKIQVAWLSNTQLVIRSEGVSVWMRTNYQEITISKENLAR